MANDRRLRNASKHEGHVAERFERSASLGRDRRSIVGGELGFQGGHPSLEAFDAGVSAAKVVVDAIGLRDQRTDVGP